MIRSRAFHSDRALLTFVFASVYQRCNGVSTRLLSCLLRAVRRIATDAIFLLLWFSLISLEPRLYKYTEIRSWTYIDQLFFDINTRTHWSLEHNASSIVRIHCCVHCRFVEQPNSVSERSVTWIDWMFLIRSLSSSYLRSSSCHWWRCRCLGLESSGHQRLLIIQWDRR